MPFWPVKELHFHVVLCQNLERELLKSVTYRKKRMGLEKTQCGFPGTNIVQRLSSAGFACEPPSVSSLAVTALCSAEHSLLAQVTAPPVLASPLRPFTAVCGLKGFIAFLA